MKPKDLGELCAATSDLANQTGTEKKRSFDHPQAELDILSFRKKKKKKKKTNKWAMETRGPKSNSSNLLCLLPATLMMIRSKMNELAWKHHFPIISLWEIFRPQGQLTPSSVVRSGRNSNSSESLCMFLLPPNIKRIGSKTTEKRWRHHCPHHRSMGAFCCHGNQSFDPICPKILCSLSPIRKLANWLQRFSSSKV